MELEICKKKSLHRNAVTVTNLHFDRSVRTTHDLVVVNSSYCTKNLQVLPFSFEADVVISFLVVL